MPNKCEEVLLESTRIIETARACRVINMSCEKAMLVAIIEVFFR